MVFDPNAEELSNMLTRLLVVFIVLLFAMQTRTQAGFWLTGVQLFEAESDGGLKVTTPGETPLYSSFRYSTNSNDTGAAKLRVSKSPINNSTLDKQISLSLIPGANTINYEVTDLYTANFIGMNLFFAESETAVSYNPVTNANIVAVPNLSVYVPLNSSAFQKVNSGKKVLNYAWVNNGPEPTTPGNLTFISGLYEVQVTAFNASTLTTYRPNNGGFGGSFTLTVTATPEPGTLGAGALACCGLLHWVRKRRKNKK